MQDVRDHGGRDAQDEGRSHGPADAPKLREDHRTLLYQSRWVTGDPAGPANHPGRSMFRYGIGRPGEEDRVTFVTEVQ
ncbi:hypothetical protein Asp14428_63890 [Actinoplanes sp. NBRC 14428]|nr:hypothetical protein Asp14428_63890 [Actinoplanes sp. NBRC 14428]